MANMSCATVEVQREVSEANPSGVVVINKADFVVGVDKLVVVEDLPAIKGAPAAGKPPIAPWNVK